MSVAVSKIEPELSSLAPGFELLYANHYDFLWRCALRLGAEPKDVEDIVQEAFVVALRRYDQTEFTIDGARPSTWLFAILHNVLRNHARSERRRRARLEAVAVGEEARVVCSLQTQASLGLRLLDEFLTELDPDRRVVFVLSELEGMRGPEIARALGLNPNTVRSRLRSARQAFAACFEQEPDRVVTEAANQTAPAQMRARGLALLMLPAKTWTTTTSSAVGWWGWVSSLRGLVAIGSLTALGVALVVSARVKQHEAPERVHTSETAPEPARLSASGPSTPIVQPASEASEASSEERPAAIVIEAKSPRVKKPTPAIAVASSEALALLERARAAMRGGDAAAALALVEAREGWPASLDAHRVALEIGALCRLDRPARARARAHAWSKLHPDSRTAVSLIPPCWHDDNTSLEGGHPVVKAPASGLEE